MSPQDNPGGMVNVLSYNNSTALVTQYNSNVSIAGNIGSLASSTITNAMNVVNQASSLAVEMANGSNTPANNLAAAQQVGQMINELQQYADTSYNGQNLFTGTNLNLSSAYSSSSASFSANTASGTQTITYNVYTYQGTDTNQNYQITQNETVTPSLTADAIFGNDPKSIATNTVPIVACAAVIVLNPFCMP